MDINTKQRPVPNELLLDIKRLADTESDTEAMFRDVFDAFEKDTSSPLLGLLTASEKRRGKISRVTFNNAIKAIDSTFEGSDATEVYNVLSAYIQACRSGLRQHGLENSITNPTLFRALMFLFPAVAERVSDRHQEFSVANFDEIVGPFFSRLKKSDFQRPGSSPHSLHESFRKTLRSGFTIGRNVFA
jgi:hypothetical protein